MNIKVGRVYEIEPGGRAYIIVKDDEIVTLRRIGSKETVKRFRGQIKLEMVREARPGER